MISRSNLNIAIEFLKKKFNVVPEKYCIYNNAYLFLAYPIGLKKSDKEKVLSPYYLVDLTDKACGPFSPAFDLKGFFEASKNFKDV